MRTLLCLSCLVLLSGCGLTLGPKTESNFLFIKHKGIAARVAEDVKVKCIVEKDGKVYEAKINLSGFYVISPDLKEEQKEITTEKPK